MLYSLDSLTPDVWGDPYNPVQTKRPTTIADALYSISDKDWDVMARDIFKLPGDAVDVYEAMEKVRQTNTCSFTEGLVVVSPVKVWIDEEGVYTVLVYSPARGLVDKKIPT